MRKTLGIIGGMGPSATADLFGKVIANTKAACDSGHMHIIVDDEPSVPDRTRAILHGGESPLPHLVASGRRLIAAGAQALIMPCNTAHYFYNELQAALSVPLINMITLCADRLRADGMTVCGVLATDGTVQSGVYGDALKSAGIRALYPDAAGQAEVMRAIYEGVKAGRPVDKIALGEVADALCARGAQALILGCTELPIAFLGISCHVTLIDPTLLLARAAVEFCGYECI